MNLTQRYISSSKTVNYECLYVEAWTVHNNHQKVFLLRKKQIQSEPVVFINAIKLDSNEFVYCPDGSLYLARYDTMAGDVVQAKFYSYCT